MSRSIPDRYQGRARAKGYTPPLPNWTDDQRIEELERIARRAENGAATPIDELAAHAHTAALERGDPQ